MKPKAVIGILGGTGLYEMKGLEKVREVAVKTPFGAPSDKYILGRLHGVSVAFLARHGRGHKLLPSDINFRANVYGFKFLGVKRLISASAVGSMKEKYRPMDVVVPDQFYDHSKNRVQSFFGNGVAAHVSMADPVCPELFKALYQSTRALKLRVHKGGTYLCMEGPSFSTRAESNIYRRWGVDVIGMTNLPEAKLAREAEICYATLALVTDYDCWRKGEEAVSVEQVIAYLRKNAENAKRVIAKTVSALAEAPRSCACGSALKNAVLTAPGAIPKAVKEKLKLFLHPHSKKV